MFSELLSRFDEALSEAKNCTSVTSKLLAESRSIEGDSRLLDPTHSYANAVSFPRQTRFH